MKYNVFKIEDANNVQNLFLRVGLIHTLFIFQVTWREEDRRIDGASIPRVDRVSAVHGSRSTHVRDKRSYNG